METNFKGTNLKAKLTHSKGSIKYELFDGLIDVWSDIDDPMGRKVALKEAKLNGRLIADAFNVRQKINVDLPDLLKQRDELLEVVKEIEYQLRKKYHIPNWMYNKANNLITKIENP